MHEETTPEVTIHPEDLMVLRGQLNDTQKAIAEMRENTGQLRNQLHMMRRDHDVLQHTIGKVQRDLSELRSDFNETWAQPQQDSPQPTFDALTDLKRTLDRLRGAPYHITDRSLLEQVASYLYAKEKR